MTSDSSSSSPSSETSSIRLSSSSASSSASTTAASSSTSTSSSTSSTSVSGELALGRDGAGRGHHGCRTAGRAGAARAVEDLEIEHARRRTGRRSGNGRSHRSGRRSSGRSASCPIRAWPNVFSDGLVASERGNCHDRPKLSKANSARTGGSGKSNQRDRGMLLRAAPHGALLGAAPLPGDKSVSHRSLMLAALAVGESQIAGTARGRGRAGDGAPRCARWASSSSATGPGSWRVWGVGVGGWPSRRRCSTWAMPVPAPGC